jgi:hypothetical protein
MEFLIAELDSVENCHTYILEKPVKILINRRIVVPEKGN